MLFSKDKIRRLQTEAHACAVEKGWHETDARYANGRITASKKLEWLALVTDELDEMEEEDIFRGIYYEKNNKPCGVAVGFADALIRLLDYADTLGFDIAQLFSTSVVGGFVISGARMRLVATIRVGKDTDIEWANLFNAIFRKAIRTVDDTQLEAAFTVKMRFNRTRPPRHGGKLA